MKNFSGVSLIQLVIVIVIITILSSLAFFYSRNVVPEVNVAKAYAEITAVKEGVENTLTLTLVNPDEYKFSSLFSEVGTFDTYYERLIGGIDLPTNAYIVSPGNSNLGIMDNTHNYELDNVTREYIIVLDTEKIRIEEIYLVNGAIDNDGNKLYSYTDIKSIYDLNN